MLNRINPTTTPSWDKLNDHVKSLRKTDLKTLFTQDQNRLDYLTFNHKHFYFDFSKNILNKETLSLFRNLADDCKLEEAKKAMFDGDPINETEGRSVLHMALRSLSGKKYVSGGKEVMSLVQTELQKIKKFTDRLHRDELLGYTGRPIRNVVNIGIGGSDLGPYMALNALRPYWKSGINPRFISNVDANHFLEATDGLNPEETLFIIASKTFTTQETMTNAETARDWFLKRAKDKSHVARHFVAVSTNEEKVNEFGIDSENMFEFWDWVGGRFSLWSSIGLIIACTVGYDNFEEMLKGAEEMDEHFLTEPFESNIPTLMAFVGILYNNFFGHDSQAILPYDHRLHHFPAYLQQAEMESNGKSVDRQRKPVDYQTGQIVWGEPGTNGQHAFYQLIHQGTKIIPCDFIGVANAHHDMKDHQEKLIANFIAQPEALMHGKSREELVEEYRSQGIDPETVADVIPLRIFGGNRPSTSILMDTLTPKNLGYLIALYEHKIFVQGIMWNIYSFDQWGVELGKKLAGTILAEIRTGETSPNHDPSTQNVLKNYMGYLES